MKRYRLVYRGNRDAYYCFDTHTKKRESLGINNADEAHRRGLVNGGVLDGGFLCPPRPTCFLSGYDVS